MEVNSVSGNPSEASMQLGLLDAVKDLLAVNPVFLIGVIVICAVLILMFRKNRAMPKVRTAAASLVLYYYLCVMLTNIVGFPTLGEYRRLTGLGETFFHPNINVIPFADGFSLSFVLNIFLFLPLGFLCPLISRRYQSVKNIFFTGLGLSFTIETVQLFTLYRATDIDDLITNTVGALVGYGCFKLIHKLAAAKGHAVHEFKEPRVLRYLPVAIIVMTLVLGFFS